jgi:hypothetical protein
MSFVPGSDQQLFAFTTDDIRERVEANRFLCQQPARRMQWQRRLGMTDSVGARVKVSR